jgi:hypothetical protein
MEMDTITLAALALAVLSIVSAVLAMLIALRQQKPVPPEELDSPDQASPAAFGWRVSPALKVWYALTALSVLTFIVAVAVLVTHAAETETNVNIISLEPGDSVAFDELVRGTSRHLPADHEIWVLVCPHGTHTYYPQSEVYRIEPGGDWSTRALIGPGPEAEGSFDVLAVLADRSASDTFRAAMADPDTEYVGDTLDELPDGVQIHDRITVVRE